MSWTGRFSHTLTVPMAAGKFNKMRTDDWIFFTDQLSLYHWYIYIKIQPIPQPSPPPGEDSTYSPDVENNIDQTDSSL